jgi:diguanylate cyclase (GGDEF)-like protein/PAS domain S-box-containing protein
MAASIEWSSLTQEQSTLTDSACRAMIHAMSHGAIMHDAEGRVVVCNPSAERVLGVESGALVGTTPFDDCWRALNEDGSALAPEEHPVLVTLRTGVPFNQVVIGFPRAGGRRVWISLNTRPILADDGQTPVAAVVTFSDFTTRREEVVELERQALVARRTNDAVIITDGEGRIQWVNAAFLELTRQGVDAVLGRKPGEVLQGPETDPETIAEMGQALAAGKGWSGEILNYRGDGTAFWIELSISPAHDGSGRITHFVSIARDISPRREAARKLFQLSTAMGASVDGMALIDSFQDFRFVNDAFAQMMGHESGEALLGKSWRTMYEKEAIRRFDTDIVTHLYMHDRWRGEITAKRRDGTTFPQELSVTLLAGGQMVLVVRDISDRKAAEAEQGRLTAILEATPDLIAITTIDGDVPYLNTAGRRLLGCGPEERLTFSTLFPEWALMEVESVGVPFAVEYGAWNGETALRTRDGREIPVSQVIIAHKNGHGEVEHLSTIMRDISERKEAEDALRKMSLSDALTGLYNRRGFFMLGQQHLNVARTHPGHAILLYFDLNDFKPINDTFGHAAGDEALKEIAAVLQETFRDSDLCGRLGGDEFVALAVNCLDPTGAVLLRRLDERLAHHNAREGRAFQLSMGRGVARFDPSNPKSLQQLLDEADARLYEDKRARKAARGGAGGR